MRIDIRVIPHAEQRYVTLGDYWDDADGVKQIRVSDLGDDKMNLLVAVHELIETYLCDAAGIAEPIVKAFDEAHPDELDPGSHPDAPYREQHLAAEWIERILADQLRVDWQTYEHQCDEVSLCSSPVTSRFRRGGTDQLIAIQDSAPAKSEAKIAAYTALRGILAFVGQMTPKEYVTALYALKTSGLEATTPDELEASLYRAIGAAWAALADPALAEPFT